MHGTSHGKLECTGWVTGNWNVQSESRENDDFQNEIKNNSGVRDSPCIVRYKHSNYLRKTLYSFAVQMHTHTHARTHTPHMHAHVTHTHNQYK